MGKLELSETNPTWEIVYANGDFPNTDHFRELMDRLYSLHRAVKLSAFDVNRDTENPQLYTYSFTTHDGRTWEQTLLLSSSGVYQTFNVVDGFLEREFVAHRELRNSVLRCIQLHRVTGIECVWS